MNLANQNWPRGFFNQSDFFFIQVGANDGVKNDTFRSVILEHRLHGLLIEPLPDVFESLKRNYKGQSQLMFENVAIGKNDGPAAFYRHPRHSVCSGLGIATKMQKRSDMLPVTVKSETFLSLILRLSIRRVDLLIVDTEGFDDMVVTSYPDDVIRLPSAIAYETKHLPRERRGSLARWLADRGYEVRCDGRDAFALLRNFFLPPIATI